MGHNVEQTFSMKNVDHWLLSGVPNTAFTEALAFVFQARDLELLGLHSPSAKDVWNQYYAPVFKKKDVVLLAVYSHMIHSFLYLPDYPIGHMIAFQIEEQMKKAGKIGPEFERMASYGSVVPDLWMTHATGKPVGPEALLQATQRALGEIRH